MTKYMFYGLLIQAFLSSFLTPADSHGQRKSIYEITLDLKTNNKSLNQILKKIEGETGFEFSYFLDEGIGQDKKRIDKNYKSEKLSTVLGDLSLAYGLHFKRVNNKIAVRNSDDEPSREIEEIVSTELQQFRVSGKVISTNGEEPLPGVSILIKGTSTGTTTDMNGDYSLNAAEGDILQFSFIGYKTQEVEVGNQTTLNLTLEEDLEQLEEVIVVGYGTTKKSDLTGSVASVKAKTISNTTSPNVVQALQGVIPGLEIDITSSSAEQNTQNIRIRGNQSITANNNPLIVLDGVPWTGSLSEIPSLDIQSVDVLKDASAASIYGSRASNGVILITTRKGKLGELSINYQGRFQSLQQAREPNLYDAQGFYNRKLEFNRLEDPNIDPVAVFSQTELDNFANGVSTNWVDEALRNGFSQEHTLSLSGGNEKNSFYISTNYLSTEGLAKNDEFNRYSLRLNFDQELTSWLTFGTNNWFTHLNRDGIAADFNEAYRMNPLTTPFDESGQLAIFPWPEDVFFQNPLEGLNSQNLNRENNFFTNNYFDLDLNFIPGLSYRLNTGIEFRRFEEETFNGAGTFDGLTIGSTSDVTNRRRINGLVEHILNYNKDWGKHSLKLTGLYSFQWIEEKTRGIRGEGFGSNVLTTYQNANANLILPSSNYEQSALISQMVRANYTFDGKYLITGTIRRDGFSAFGDNDRFGIFPSLALGWNLTEEPFMQETSNWLNVAKLRVSWGETGNQAIAPYTSLSNLNILNYLGGANGQSTATGFIPSRLANPSLGWETTQTLNFGLDFMLLKGKISGALDIFSSNVSDLLLAREISPILGVAGSSITQNIGEVQNRGVELALNAVVLEKDDWQIDMTLTLNRSRNEIKELYGDGEDDIVNEWFIGEPIDVFFGYQFDGIFQTGDDIAGSAQPNAEPGFVRIADTNGDGEITPDDRTIVGQAIPDFRAGLNANIRYKNLTANLFFYGVSGVERPNDLGNPKGTFQWRRNTVSDWNYWTSTNPTNEFLSNSDRSNDFDVQRFENASFLRLRDIRLSYNFTSLLNESWKVKNLGLFLGVNNVFTVTDWTGIDPEILNQSSVPQQRIYQAGLNVSF